MNPELQERLKRDYGPTERFLSCMKSAMEYWGGDWPITIVATRYSGAYERFDDNVSGDYAAFPTEMYALENENWAAGDTECDWWWIVCNEKKLPIGLGGTPDDALADLKRRLPPKDYAWVCARAEEAKKARGE